MKKREGRDATKVHGGLQSEISHLVYSVSELHRQLDAREAYIKVLGREHAALVVERDAWKQSHNLNAERMLAAERQAAILRAEVDSDTELLLTKDLEVVRLVGLIDGVCGTSLDAMLTWPTGSNGPLAVAAYELLVRRLAHARSALAKR